MEDFQHNTGSVLPQRSAYKWVENFKSGRTSVTHEGAKRPPTATTDNIERVRYMVLLDEY